MLSLLVRLEHRRCSALEFQASCLIVRNIRPTESGHRPDWPNAASSSRRLGNRPCGPIRRRTPCCSRRNAPSQTISSRPDCFHSICIIHGRRPIAGAGHVVVKPEGGKFVVAEAKAVEVIGRRQEFFADKDRIAHPIGNHVGRDLAGPETDASKDRIERIACRTISMSGCRPPVARGRRGVAAAERSVFPPAGPLPSVQRHSRSST